MNMRFLNGTLPTKVILECDTSYEKFKEKAKLIHKDETLLVFENEKHTYEIDHGLSLNDLIHLEVGKEYEIQGGN